MTTSLLRTVAAGLLALAAAAAFAAGSSTGGQAVIAYWDQPKSLDPADADFGTAVSVLSAFGASLVTTDSSMADAADLAEKWTVSSDSLTWTFTLRPNLRFSDGSPLTSADVLATFMAQKDSLGTTDQGQIIKSMDAPDAVTFRLFLSAPYSDIVQLATPIIRPAAVLNGSAQRKIDYERLPYSAGPFKLVEWTPDHITLVKNPHYSRSKVRLDRVVFQHFQTRDKAWSAFLRGEVDVMFDIDATEYAFIGQDTRFQAHSYLDQFYYALLFNLKDPLLSSPGIRKAISLAVDRNDLIDKVLPNRAAPTSGPFTPGTWPYNPDPRIQPYDLAQARKILGDLGWKDTNGDWVLDKGGRDLRFTVTIVDDDGDIASVVKRLQWQLMQAGIRLDAELVPIDELVRDRLVPRTFQSAVVWEATFGNPDALMSRFWTTTALAKDNFTSYSNPAVDRLVTLARTITNADRKAEIYQDIHRTVSSDAPAVFLYFLERYTACSSRLRGYDAGGVGAVAAGMENWYVQ